MGSEQILAMLPLAYNCFEDSSQVETCQSNATKMKKMEVGRELTQNFLKVTFFF